MKRKFACGTIALCLALSMAGCGGKSSEERQAANYYQNELGLDKDEAEELAHYLYGEDEEEEEPSVSEQAPQETVVEPLPELLDSEWWERKVQIYDMVFTRDEGLTEEVIRKIVEESTYDVELEEGFDKNGEVCLNGIMLDGKRIVSLSQKSRYSTYVNAGFFENGNYYDFGNGHVYLENNFYDKGIMEVEAIDFRTRDDVLSYLTENGFIEVDEKQTYMNAAYDYNEGCYYIKPGAEFVDEPHYNSNGAQSITFCRVHKLYETDQEIEFANKHYSGCHLNLFSPVSIEFNTDGTIAAMNAEVFSEPRYVLILGEKID